jgi:purine-binding chemotaxis protein CheW
MNRLLLIVRLGGERIAFPAGEVESVVEIESLTPIPAAAPHVAGLTALRSRVLTVIDPLVAIDPHRRQDSPHEAVVVVHDGHPYALLVEGVEDVVEAEGEVSAVPAALAGGWARIAAGLVEAEGDLLLLADLPALIAGAPARAAA